MMATPRTVRAIKTRRRAWRGGGLFLGVAIACAANAQTADRTPRTAWGKPGVGFDQYVADGAACAREGYYLDISATDAAHALSEASRQLDMLDGPVISEQDAIMRSNQASRIQEGTQPRKRFAEVGKLMQAKIDGCLTSRGYTRFALTESQRKMLGKLRIGSIERRRYLHALASDAEVVGKQSVARAGERPAQ